MLVGGEIVVSTVSTFTVFCRTHTAWQFPLQREREKLCGPQCDYTELHAFREEAALLLYIQTAFYVTCKTGVS